LGGKKNHKKTLANFGSLFLMKNPLKPFFLAKLNFPVKETLEPKKKKKKA
jgi:hypothetical protein